MIPSFITIFFSKLRLDSLILYSIISDLISKFLSMDKIFPLLIINNDLSLKYFIFLPFIVMPSSLIIAVALLATVTFWSFEISMSVAWKSISLEKDLLIKKSWNKIVIIIL